MSDLNQETQPKPAQQAPSAAPSAERSRPASEAGWNPSGEGQSLKPSGGSSLAPGTGWEGQSKAGGSALKGPPAPAAPVLAHWADSDPGGERGRRLPSQEVALDEHLNKGPTPAPPVNAQGSTTAPGGTGTPGPLAATPTNAVYKSGAQMKLMTLAQLKTYADEQIDWANNPKLTDVERDEYWRWVLFARESEGNLAGCGSLAVADLEKTAKGKDELDALRSYGGAISAKRITARLTTPATSTANAISFGHDLAKMEESIGGPTLKRTVDDAAFKLLHTTKGLIDYVIDYTNVCSPVMDAENGTEYQSIAAMKKANTPYSAYKASLKDVKNLHRFEEPGLKQAALNVGDTSKSKPMTLVLHSALDHNGAFHRDPNMTAVLKDTRNLTLMIEGAESLDAIKAQIDPLAKQYGKNNVIDQVMIAGHGNSDLIELGGKMGMNDRGQMAERGEALTNKDAKSGELLDELLKHMDPASPNHKVVFNACLTNSNSVDTKAIEDAVAAGKSPADAVKEAMDKNPSFAAGLNARAKALGKAGIVGLGANNSIGQVKLQDAKTGALDLKDPGDPFATGAKIDYAESGLEPLGVMRSVVDSWAQDKDKTIAAMRRRVKATPKDWRGHIVTPIFKIILDGQTDNISLINDFSEWAGNLGEGLSKPMCRVGRFRPPASVAVHMPAVIKELLTSVDFGDSKHFPMVLHQTLFLSGQSDAAAFLKDLSAASWNCQNAEEFLDGGLMSHAGDLLGAVKPGSKHAQLILALLNVATNDPPNADAKTFLLAQAIKDGKLNADARAILAQKASDDLMLERLGLGHKPTAGAAPKANADTDGDKTNETYVETMSEEASIGAPFGPATLYAAPDDKSTQVGTLVDGTKVTLVGQTDKFYAIKHGLKLAYISKGDIWHDKKDKATPFTALGVVDNPFGEDVRAAPDASSAIVESLKVGAEVEIIAKTKDFYTVHHQHKTAFISRYSVEPVRRSLVRKTGQGTIDVDEIDLQDRVGTGSSASLAPKVVGQLKRGAAVELLAALEDDAPSIMGHKGRWFAIKHGDGYAWLVQSAVKLNP